MKIKSLIVVFFALLLFSLSAPTFAQEAITPEEIIAKVNEAAEFLAEKGEAGLLDFNAKEGPWVWGGTYVFVFNCGEGLVVAHPNNDLIGIELASRMDDKGNRYNLDLCEASKDPKGGWVEYWRPTDELDANGEVKYRRKISYILKVEGQPFEVGAGIYEPEMTIDELNDMLE